MMINENMLVWDVRGLNARARRYVVHDLVAPERVSLVMLQETKLDVCNHLLIKELLEDDFDYRTLPATHTFGGILVAWRKQVWSISSPLIGEFSMTAKIQYTTGDVKW